MKRNYENKTFRSLQVDEAIIECGSCFHLDAPFYVFSAIPFVLNDDVSGLTC